MKVSSIPQSKKKKNRFSMIKNAPMKNIMKACNELKEHKNSMISRRITEILEMRHTILKEMHTRLLPSPKQAKVQHHSNKVDDFFGKQQKMELDFPIRSLLKIEIPLPLLQISGELGIATLFLRITLSDVLMLLKLLLLEHSILVIGDNIEQVTSCTFALLDLLKPYK